MKEGPVKLGIYFPYVSLICGFNEVRRSTAKFILGGGSLVGLMSSLRVVRKIIKLGTKNANQQKNIGETILEHTSIYTLLESL